MKISMIAAMAKNRVIGHQNGMPWHLPDDLKFFKAVTTGKPVIMGRKTFESIGSRPLPNRRNMVISRDSSLKLNEGVELYASIEEALSKLDGCDEVIIMGGGQLYEKMLPQADRLYLTLIDAEIEGDTYFPDWTQYQWQVLETEKHKKDDRHTYEFEFITLDKK